jgi:hypothetical protein
VVARKGSFFDAVVRAVKYQWLFGGIALILHNKFFQVLG